ncbi:hypothetical protein ACYOEI_17375 [Singulisphaera rosea]
MMARLAPLGDITDWSLLVSYWLCRNGMLIGIVFYSMSTTGPASWPSR